jgi:hypothetical protein
MDGLPATLTKDLQLYLVVRTCRGLRYGTGARLKLELTRSPRRRFQLTAPWYVLVQQSAEIPLRPLELNADWIWFLAFISR